MESYINIKINLFKPIGALLVVFVADLRIPSTNTGFYNKRIVYMSFWILYWFIWYVVLMIEL